MESGSAAAARDSAQSADLRQRQRQREMPLLTMTETRVHITAGIETAFSFLKALALGLKRGTVCVRWCNRSETKTEAETRKPTAHLLEVGWVPCNKPVVYACRCPCGTGMSHKSQCWHRFVQSRFPESLVPTQRDVYNYVIEKPASISICVAKHWVLMYCTTFGSL